ncbi:MAG: 4-nitrophenol 2-monooxygenase / 4-nitrocatechol 4-monooxygenase, reductase component [Thermoleophilaceae bacterium]|jgi:flavin reductase ActVB|nr:4-nitrophenol 2-monooxygenase / 4-nitrocatechol 4-monooxygenase, reductase component [Thermoleophilaceae bacterium]MEA2408930.1 4-nitrophenol 2-monooxygenase / 4-nitrocatechol 4-monooxygenase, reductase component [Thermoleophilaceae bacterium]
MAAAAAEHELAPGFREAMSLLATGVVLVTTHVDGRPWGTTVSACCSVSMEPPLLLVSLARESASAQAITAEGRFGVCILGGHLLEVARFGSAPGQPKFIESFCKTDDSKGQQLKSPVIAGAPAHVDCRVERRIEAGDHILFLGEVEAVAVSGNIGPLVYFARGFHTLPGPSAESADLEGAITALLANGYQW